MLCVIECCKEVETGERALLGILILCVIIILVNDPNAAV
jgi:hypothetical protein